VSCAASSVAVTSGDEQLVEDRFGVPGHGAEGGIVDGDLPPGEQVEVLFLDDRLDGTHRVQCGHAGGREEGDTRGIGAGSGQVDALVCEHLAVETVRDLHQDAGAVTGVLLGPRGTTVVEVDQGLDALLDDVVRGPAVHVGNEGDATGIVLVGRVVEPLGRRVVLQLVVHGVVILRSSGRAVRFSVARGGGLSSVGVLLPY
jgi:hypothetical protein